MDHQEEEQLLDPYFGGSYGGTPAECQECKKAVNCKTETDGKEGIGGSGELDGTESVVEVNAGGSSG